MKRRFRTMSALLTMVLAEMFCAFTFTACSDDDNIENEVTYTYGFAEMSASHPDFLEEMGKIENAFKSALGTTGSSFTKRGTVEECDKEVYAACEKAYQSLQGDTWQGDYIFEVTNTLTGEVVCIAVFNADNENIFGGSSKGAMYRTSKNFIQFVKNLDPDFPTSVSKTLTCTDFRSQQEAHIYLLNQIDYDDVKAREYFSQLNYFATDYVRVNYQTENVKDGFAKLDITFRMEKNSPKYYIIFKNPDN